MTPCKSVKYETLNRVNPSPRQTKNLFWGGEKVPHLSTNHIYEISAMHICITYLENCNKRCFPYK